MPQPTSTTIGDEELLTQPIAPQEQQQDDNIFGVIAQWMEENKPKPRTKEIAQQGNLAKVHAIGEGLRTFAEGIGLYGGTPVERRNPNTSVLKSIQERNRLAAEDEAKKDAFNRLALDLKLKGAMDKRGQKEKADAAKKEQERYNTNLDLTKEQKNFEREKWDDENSRRIKNDAERAWFQGEQLEETKRYHDLVAKNNAQKNANTAANNSRRTIILEEKFKQGALKGNPPNRKVIVDGVEDELTPAQQYRVLSLAYNDKENANDMVISSLMFDNTGKTEMTEGAKYVIDNYWAKYKDQIVPTGSTNESGDTEKQVEITNKILDGINIPENIDKDKYIEINEILLDAVAGKVNEKTARETIQLILSE